MLGIDYVGLGALVSAIGAAIVSVIVALRQTATIQNVKDVHAAVSTSNGMTLGQAVEQIGRDNPAAPTAQEAKP